ncbi:phytochromobilin:ferredoxin oxidoreductase, chloroplastic [Nicotiana tabacum]|uniref:Phytochromobilin:ferredoxin oxidoreductase, chloroplastic n=1 Tax=Nicotiana tabacum TaxID=4097 RepID=A0A1S3X5V2_TOBAC|nr:PREDICTED: phytochromobilin:ferredoxin oxidoreductase, chloroplastic-like [Nicotiana tabacum]
MECLLPTPFSFSSSFSSPSWFSPFLVLKNSSKLGFNRKLCSFNRNGSRSTSMSHEMESSVFSYKKLIHFALEETNSHTQFVPSPLQEKYSSLLAMDDETELQMLSFEAPKIRLLRSLCIEGSDGMQVLDFAAFPKPEFDLPIFCANFFTAAKMNIIVLDLNPLHDVMDQEDYKEKYYKGLIPLGLKYSELLPWGGKLTSESLKFFSPIVIWTRFSSSPYNHSVLFSAFKDYYKAWLELMDRSEEETDASQVDRNREAQHRYLTWRAEKDPGHGVLKRLVGEALAKDVISEFLFNGVNKLGSKTFLDYFPEYRCEDGRVNEKRSMIGKSFESRPWNARGEFIGNRVS